MILSSQFGYASRHKINFNTEAKRGSLILWSDFDGFGIAPNPLTFGEGLISESIAFLAKCIFNSGTNLSVEFPFGSDDVLSLLAALTMVKNGKEYLFSNCEGRTISFTFEGVGKKNRGAIIVKIRYSKRTGKLVLQEVNQLESLTREILLKLGDSEQQIAEKLEQTVKAPSAQANRHESEINL